MNFKQKTVGPGAITLIALALLVGWVPVSYTIGESINVGVGKWLAVLGPALLVGLPRLLLSNDDEMPKPIRIGGWIVLALMIAATLNAMLG